MSDELPRHIRLTLLTLQRAFETDDYAALGTINESIQPIADAAVTRIHTVKAERDKAHADLAVCIGFLERAGARVLELTEALAQSQVHDLKLMGERDKARKTLKVMERSAPDILPGPTILSASDILALANARRIRLGMSWRAVAREVGCAASTLSRWSNGVGSPSIAALYAVWCWAADEPPPDKAPSPPSSSGCTVELVIRDGRRFVQVPEEDWLGALATIEIMGQPGAVEAILEAAATPAGEWVSSEDLDWGDEEEEPADREEMEVLMGRGAPATSPADRLAEIESRYEDRALGQITDDITWLVARIHELEKRPALRLTHTIAPPIMVWCSLCDHSAAECTCEEEDS